MLVLDLVSRVWRPSVSPSQEPGLIWNHPKFPFLLGKETSPWNEGFRGHLLSPPPALSPFQPRDKAQELGPHPGVVQSHSPALPVLNSRRSQLSQLLLDYSFPSLHHNHYSSLNYTQQLLTANPAITEPPKSQKPAFPYKNGNPRCPALPWDDPRAGKGELQGHCCPSTWGNLRFTPTPSPGRVGLSFLPAPTGIFPLLLLPVARDRVGMLRNAGWMLQEQGVMRCGRTSPGLPCRSLAQSQGLLAAGIALMGMFPCAASRFSQKTGSQHARELFFKAVQRGNVVFPPLQEKG